MKLFTAVLSLVIMGALFMFMAHDTNKENAMCTLVVFIASYVFYKILTDQLIKD